MTFTTTLHANGLWGVLSSKTYLPKQRELCYQLSNLSPRKDLIYFCSYILKKATGKFLRQYSWIVIIIHRKQTLENYSDFFFFLFDFFIGCFWHHPYDICSRKRNSKCLVAFPLLWFVRPLKLPVKSSIYSDPDRCILLGKCLYTLPKKSAHKKY